MKGLLIVGIALVVLGGGGLAVWLLQPEPVAETEPVDTGLSIEAQTRLMQEIGYLQQE